MSHLVRQEIRALIKSGKLLRGTPSFDSPEFEFCLQPDSFDLRIGTVVANGRPVILQPRQYEYMLPPGEMAIVVTEEQVDIPTDMAGEVSPPNYMLNAGLLVLAAPHVDPGYQGPLTARVVNLLDKSYHLSASLHILTIRFYRLSAQTECPYDKNVAYTEKLNRAVQESRDTFNKLFLSEEELVLKRDLRSAAFIEALTWLSVLVPVIAVLVPFSVPFFWRLGQDLSSAHPQLVELVPLFAVIILGPLFLVGYSWFWLWVGRRVFRRR